MPRRVTIEEIQALENENAYLKNLIKTKFKDMDVKITSLYDENKKAEDIAQTDFRLSNLEFRFNDEFYVKGAFDDRVVQSVLKRSMNGDEKIHQVVVDNMGLIQPNEAYNLSYSPGILHLFIQMLQNPVIKEQIINITIDKSR